MSSSVNSGVDRSVPGYGGDRGEIRSLAPSTPVAPAVRTMLRPQEEVLSLPPDPNSLPDTIAPLTRFLGPALTYASAAWVGDPVPRMRALQKKLVAHSLTLDEGERGPSLAAISVVERNVQWRLRYQQMRMNEAELNMPTTPPQDNRRKA